MLNETLNRLQTDDIEIRAPKARVLNTGIADTTSANADAKELTRQRFQRMRRRRERVLSSNSIASGWVARMA